MVARGTRGEIEAVRTRRGLFEVDTRAWISGDLPGFRPGGDVRVAVVDVVAVALRVAHRAGGEVRHGRGRVIERCGVVQMTSGRRQLALAQMIGAKRLAGRSVRIAEMFIPGVITGPVGD